MGVGGSEIEREKEQKISVLVVPDNQPANPKELSEKDAQKSVLFWQHTKSEIDSSFSSTIM